MSKSVFIVYRTDPWHSYDSRDMWGVFTSVYKAIASIRKHFKISKYQVGLLRDIKQTQTSSDEEDECTYDGEFVIDEQTLNEVL